MADAVNVAALVAYDGTRYHGFQRQSAQRGPTVQGELEAAIARITGEEARLTGAGRTDSGVHASGQVVNFTAATRLDESAWLRALNAWLPEDIAIRSARFVGADFHARLSALGRRYRYRVVCDPARSPLRERYAWRSPRRLDVAAMDSAARLLLGEHDFGAFGSSPWDQRGAAERRHTVRRMSQARCLWLPQRLTADDDPLAGAAEDTGEPDEIAFDFAANGFLTGMARRLVGTLALVGAGRMSVAEFGQTLDSRDKTHAGPSAPPHGLCLTGVEYPAGMVHW
ncbi:MAG TPA: tRNA pseudouridine(38-40) synthase TruA [Ktedonobacterales bacterium]|nr:tRNA pseudouridine(38-40) synthase TruA [Ktedonobacterales bacterium]